MEGGVSLSRGSFVVALCTVILISTACAPPAPGGPSQPAPSQAPAAPKRLTAAIRGDPKSLSEPISNAAVGSSTAGIREVEQMVNSGLVVLDSKGELRPQLAEAVPTIQNGLWKLLPEGRMETPGSSSRTSPGMTGSRSLPTTSCLPRPMPATRPCHLIRARASAL
jgi:hypothetical protein